MGKSLCGLALVLGALGWLAAGQPPGARQLSGEDARRAAQWAGQVKQLLDEDDLGEALRLAEKLHQLRQGKQGPDPWQTWAAAFQVGEVKRLRQRPPEERQQVRRADRLNAAGVQHYRDGRYAEAEKLYRQALALRQEALPAGHPDLAQSLTNLAGNLHAQGKH